MPLCMGGLASLPTTLTRCVLSSGRLAHDGEVEHPTDQAATHRAELGRGRVQRHSRGTFRGAKDQRSNWKHADFLPWPTN